MMMVMVTEVKYSKWRKNSRDIGTKSKQINKVGLSVDQVLDSNLACLKMRHLSATIYFLGEILFFKMIYLIPVFQF